MSDEKEILSAKGSLRYYVKHIVKKKLRLRYVMIELVLFGRKRTVLVGIRREGEDMEKVENPRE